MLLLPPLLARLRSHSPALVHVHAPVCPLSFTFTRPRSHSPVCVCPPSFVFDSCSYSHSCSRCCCHCRHCSAPTPAPAPAPAPAIVAATVASAAAAAPTSVFALVHAFVRADPRYPITHVGPWFGLRSRSFALVLCPLVCLAFVRVRSCYFGLWWGSLRALQPLVYVYIKLYKVSKYMIVKKLTFMA